MVRQHRTRHRAGIQHQPETAGEWQAGAASRRKRRTARLAGRGRAWHDLRRTGWHDTALIGAYLDNSFAGAAYVFTRSGSIWSQQQKLIPTGAVDNGAFGYSVALDGNIALIGAYADNSSIGAAYMFTYNGSIWSQQQ